MLMLLLEQQKLFILVSWILCSSLVTVQSAPLASPSNKTIVPATLPGYVTVLDDAGPVIKFKPPPIINSDRSKGWSFLNDSRIAAYFEKSVHSTSMNGATAILTFVGTGIGFLTSLRPNHGSVSIKVDGKDYGIVDTYAAKPAFFIEAWSLQGLPSQDHTIVITAVSDKNAASSGTFVDIDGFVVYNTPNDPTVMTMFTQPGLSGVSAMQLQVTSLTKAIIFDKAENNPAHINGHPGWVVEYDLFKNTYRTLNPVTNSFCAGGGFLSNGTLVNTGGNAAVGYGDLNGLQGIRLFTPCDDGKCNIIENVKSMHLLVNRWYPTTISLPDGTLIIMGGAINGGWISTPADNSASYEFWPPRSTKSTKMKLLADTVPINLFPHAFLLPNGRLFVQSNRKAMTFDYVNNIEYRLPDVPGNAGRTNPEAGMSVLLPLDPAKNYKAEVMICGGSSWPANQFPSTNLSSQTPADKTCARMDLNASTPAWTLEQMPEARIMPDGIILPDGKILILNGGRTGVGGYSNVKNRVGNSNAVNPVLTPVLYDPDAPLGSRFSRDGYASSTIPRLYHSSASLTPNGTVVIMGSNPNLDVSTHPYQTEYRVEFFYPPYMFKPRPTVFGVPSNIFYGTDFVFSSSAFATASKVRVALVAFGFSTHAINMNQRHLILNTKVQYGSKTNTIAVINGVRDANLFPPGPVWLFLVVNGVPAVAQKTMLAEFGSSIEPQRPPVNPSAVSNVAGHNKPDQTLGDVGENGE